MTVAILQVERHPKLDIRVDLRAVDSPEEVDPNLLTLDLAPYVVRLTQGADFAEQPFHDEFEARAHFRNVCRHALGFAPAYAAPTFAAPIFGSSEEVALDFYSRYHSRLMLAGVGSEQAKVLMCEMIDDPAFAEHMPEIIKLCGTSSDWVNATIRTVCHRICAIETATTKAEIERVPGFGVF